MPGSATLGANLVDSLLGMVDDLRGSLNPDMGVRQWRVYVQRRTWSSGRVGSGTPVNAETQILPQPLVDPDGRYFSATPAGLDETGTLTISEVSLTYTESELMSAGNSATELLYVLRDAYGQGLRERYFVLKSPPKPDRVNTIGWVLQLTEVTVDGCAL